MFIYENDEKYEIFHCKITDVISYLCVSKNYGCKVFDITNISKLYCLLNCRCSSFQKYSPIKHNILNKDVDSSIKENIHLHNHSDFNNDLNKSFSSLIEMEQTLADFKDVSQSSEESLLFTLSSNDLLKYGISSSSTYKKEKEEKVTQSLINPCDSFESREIVSECASPCLKDLNPLFNIDNNDCKSSSVKDFEDNVSLFYDCKTSSIECSELEDYTISFDDSSLDNSIFGDDEIFQNLNHNCEITTTVVPEYNITSSSSSDVYSRSKIVPEKQLSNESSQNKKRGISSFEDCDKYCFDLSVNSKKKKFRDNDLGHKIKNNCSKDELNKNLDLKLFDEELDVNNLVSPYILQSQNKKRGISSSEDCDKYCFDLSVNSKKKRFRDDLGNKIKNNCSIDELNKNLDVKLFDEKLDVNNLVSPYILQSVAKSTSSHHLKNALVKTAADNINNKMGKKALHKYIVQQTMTDVFSILHKSLDTCPMSNVLMEDPKGLMVSLMPHQKYALAWLMWRESQKPRGGILADDMGLGKTLSMISLILKSSENEHECVSNILNCDKTINSISGGTLIICPASLISQWEIEVKTKLSPGLLTVGQYYGVNRNITAKKLAKNNLVTTSYHVVMWEFKKRQKSSPLFKIKWKRIILDEAHYIRNHKTQTSFAVCNLNSIYRWAITGTPIHNKEADFFTMLKFVGCKPFDDWRVWNRWIYNNDDSGKHRLSLIVKTLMLRRTKKELSQFTSFTLPSKYFHTIEIELSKEEKNAYEKLLQFSSNLFATYLCDKAEKKKVLNSNLKDINTKIQYFQERIEENDNIFNEHPELQKLFVHFTNIKEIQNHHILVLLLRLRQICCHPCLIIERINENNYKDDGEDNLSDDDDKITDNFVNEKSTIECASNLIDSIDLISLMNNLTLTEKSFDKTINNDVIFRKSWISSKIKAVCDTVKEKVLFNGCEDKAIIVSQWSSMLYLIRKNLCQYDVKIEMYTGDIPIKQRNKIVDEFNSPSSLGPQILLLSLNAGGVGLNLMAANHMFMVDVHWNPQLEAQACDRIYRLGQTKPVNIYKFVCKNTIEARILLIQAHKLQIAQNLFDGVLNIAPLEITLDDLKQIFQSG